MPLISPDHARIAVRHVLAELLDFVVACLLHGVHEVDVFTEPHLLLKHNSPADAVELVAVALQAADHTR